MATGVLISSFPYVGVAPLGVTFGGYTAPSSVRVLSVQISAQIAPQGGNIQVTLVKADGTAYAGGVAMLAAGSSYQNTALAAPFNVAPNGVIRARITGVDNGTAADLVVNLVGATAQGAQAPAGCGPGVDCPPPVGTLLFFQGTAGPQGEAGPTGPTGPVGPPGVVPQLFVGSLAALRVASVTGLTTGYLASVTGYAAPDDGGAGFFTYDATSVATDNDGTIIQPTVGAGRWFRLYSAALNPQWFGAKGNGTTDDRAAIQKTVDASYNGAIDFPPLRFAVAGEVLIDATQGRLSLRGYGATLIATGATNKIFHTTGVAGSTVNEQRIAGFRFESSTSGVSAAAIHLDGIAHWTVKDVDIEGYTKFAYGIRCTGAQQGEICGSQIRAEIDLLCELGAGSIASNGIETHGNTFRGRTSHAVLQSIDTGFFHSNHLNGNLISAIDVSGVYGQPMIFDNHIEPSAGADGVIIRSGRVAFVGNTIAHPGPATDLLIMAAAYEAKVTHNLFVLDVTIQAACADTMFAFNSTGGTVTDGGTRTRNFCNRAFDGTPIEGTKLYDGQEINSSAAAAGDIQTLKPAAVSGSWGQTIEGFGSGDIYTRYGAGGPIVGGNTGDGFVHVKSAVGGTEWSLISDKGVRGDPMVIAMGTPVVLDAGKAGFGGVTQATVGAAGGASALPATPSIYLVWNVYGTDYVMPLYAKA